MFFLDSGVILRIPVVTSKGLHGHSTPSTRPFIKNRIEEMHQKFLAPPTHPSWEELFRTGDPKVP